MCLRAVLEFCVIVALRNCLGTLMYVPIGLFMCCGKIVMNALPAAAVALWRALSSHSIVSFATSTCVMKIPIFKGVNFQ